MRPELLSILAALLVTLAPSGASADAVDAPDRHASAEDRLDFERAAERCFGRLEAALERAGYSSLLRVDWALGAPSIVDAAEELRRAEGVDVVLLTDGTRMHAVAPFLSHSRSRTLVRFAHGETEAPVRRLCLFARAVQEDAGLRASQRLILFGVALLGFGVFGLGLFLLDRGEREAATDDGGADAERRTGDQNAR